MNASSSQPELADLIAWAHQAGQILRDGFGNHGRLHYKDATDVVTEIDHRSEGLLVERIRSRFPDHAIIAEESGRHSGQDGRCWYIDPLDGTINFAHGLAFFCVSLAYAEQGVPKLGVVFDPIHEETFSAARGAGAFLNGQPLRTGGAGSLRECLLVTGLPHREDSPDSAAFNLFRDLTLQTQGVRRLGSAALDLCYTACGRLDGYWELFVNPYDIAAGALIAREAGCQVSKVNGDEDVLTPPASILAGNPRVYAMLRQALRARGI
ncbi:MAG: inositol monophosphatase family protein [Bellilinea sp.]|jgi:myo-inositol-1(or 4)-monophosphatase